MEGKCKKKRGKDNKRVRECEREGNQGKTSRERGRKGTNREIERKTQGEEEK